MDIHGRKAWVMSTLTKDFRLLWRYESRVRSWNYYRSLMFVNVKMVTANCVPLIYADVLANNGVVHVVDSVLPPADQSLQQLILSRRELSTFAKSIYDPLL